MSKSLAVIVAAGLSAAGSANAALLVYEPFNYSVAANIMGDNTNALGLTGTFTEANTSNTLQIVSGSLGIGSLSTAGNRALMTPGANGDGFIVNLGASVKSAITPVNDSGASKTYWFSFTWSGSAPSATNDSEIGLHGTNTTRPTGAILANEGGVYVGLNQTTGTVPTADTTYFYLAKATIQDVASANNQLSITGWQLTALPANEAALGTGVSNTKDFNDTALPLNWTVKQQFATGVSFYIDEFRLGETFGDVVIVPEPSSAALLGLATLGFLLRRRRR